MASIKKFTHIVLGLALSSAVSVAQAYGGDGHQLVGKIADQLLGQNAKSKVAEILGSNVGSLEVSGPWPDCVKSIVRGEDGSFDLKKEKKGSYPECKVFNTGDELELMKLYAENNWSEDGSCSVKPDEKPRHNSYHFTDVPIQRSQYVYDPAVEHVGVGPEDIVHAIEASLSVLRDQAAPAPFCFSGPAAKKQALMLLTHLLGDLHQPLHVGSIYLKGTKPYDPDAPGESYDVDRNDTRGGNRLEDPKAVSFCDKDHPEKRCAKKLHAEWDDTGSLPNQWAAMAADAEQVNAPDPQKSTEEWIEQWATESLQQSQVAFKGMRFTKANVVSKDDWFFIEGNETPTLAERRQIQRDQIVLAGARLAKLLNSIWP